MFVSLISENMDSARCWPPYEAPPLVSDSQPGPALWALQEDDGKHAGQESDRGHSHRQGVVVTHFVEHIHGNLSLTTPGL